MPTTGSRDSRTGPGLVDEHLHALLERLAGNFVLFASERASPGPGGS